MLLADVSRFSPLCVEQLGVGCGTQHAVLYLVPTAMAIHTKVLLGHMYSMYDVNAWRVCVYVQYMGNPEI